MAGWGFAWLIGHLAATVALKGQFLPSTRASAWLLAPIVALGGLTLRAYLRFLDASTSETRRSQATALAVALGTAGIAATGYRLLERLGAPRMDLGDPLWIGLAVWGLLSWRGSRFRG